MWKKIGENMYVVRVWKDVRTVVIPKPLRDKLGWTVGTKLDWKVTDHGIVLWKADDK